MADLLVFVDKSDGVYALIAVRENCLGELNRNINWVVHFKDLGGEGKKFSEGVPAEIYQN